MIDRDQFYYLFVHANSLAELGLLSAAAAAERSMQTDTPVPAELADPEARPDFSDLDLASMDGLDFYGGESDPELVSEPPDRSEETTAGPVLFASEADFTIDSYLDRAHGHEERLRSRIETAFGKANLEHLQQLLASSPDDLPPLTHRLSGEELVRWLSRYKAGDEIVSQIVLTVRQLEA